MSAEILIYGCDSILLQTRCLVLQRAGFEVVDAPAGLAALEPILRKCDPAVILFCSSSPPDQRLLELRTCRELRPRMKIIAIEDLAGRQNVPEADRSIGCLEGPEALIETIHSLIASFPGVS